MLKGLEKRMNKQGLCQTELNRSRGCSDNKKVEQTIQERTVKDASKLTLNTTSLSKY